METMRLKTQSGQSSRLGFTLVELLVVITIIGILVALLSVAAAAAIKRGRQAAIKTELDQVSVGIESYKNDVAGSYPPNLQNDGTGGTLIDENRVFADLQRHLKQAYPKHREPENLLRVLAGLAPQGTGAGDFPEVLEGGMSAGEAIVFWLSGFSADPKYPISGEGGPSYPIANFDDDENNQLDPIESRKWIFPFEIARLEPRDADNYFNDTDGDDFQGRFIEYFVRVNGQDQRRRINFWQYVPRNSEQPYLYFDTSRHGPTEVFNGAVVSPSDPPAATLDSPFELHVHALKKANPIWSDSTDGEVPPTVYVNPDKFQILHAGVDDEWGDFDETSFHVVLSSDPADYLLYPDGPFTGEVADTIVNFSDRTLEDSQP